jgi:hypothetical protein
MEKKALGRFTLCATFPFRRRSVFVPSECPVFTLSVVFIHLPEKHTVGDLRLFPPNMQPHSFSKTQLAAIELMYGEGEKNTALSD